VTIGRLFHVLHAAEELDPLDAFYDRLFAPWHGMMERRHSPRELRLGSLLVIADGVVEIAAPSDDPRAASAPIGRFVARFGRHLHSLAWYCDDVAEVSQRLLDAGVRVLLPDGRPLVDLPEEGDIYTHPRDTGTQLEFYQPPVSHGGPGGSGPFPDPRFSADWPDRWAASANPLGVTRLSHVTVVVGDLERAVVIWRDGVGGVVLAEASDDLAGTDSAFLGVGPASVVELATPTRSGTPAARDLATFGDTCHAVTFGVADLGAVADHLARVGVAELARDATTIATDPDDTFGAAMRFTTGWVPGDPRDRP
jgi:catechol 2,3-dioxygenase-like lactoylglutathione lyase family enzyme